MWLLRILILVIKIGALIVTRIRIRIEEEVVFRRIIIRGLLVVKFIRVMAYYS